MKKIAAIDIGSNAVRMLICYVISSGKEYIFQKNTYLRLNSIKNLEPPIIICNEDQRFLVAEQMLEINIKPKSIILEPEGKNTAPAIALAALLTKKKEEDLEAV